jgi:hypothetical protein
VSRAIARKAQVITDKTGKGTATGPVAGAHPLVTPGGTPPVTSALTSRIMSLRKGLDNIRVGLLSDTGVLILVFP